jgi:putative DNA primase/helicase
MFVRDISFLAGLVSGRRMRDDIATRELAGLSARFRPLAQRLLAAASHERPPIWDEFLAGAFRPERSVCIPGVPETPLAISDAGPPRSDSGQSSLVAPESTAAESAGRRIRMTCAVDLKPRAVEWLWSGRVPLGMITMFAGDPKLGKSYVTLSMAAALSRGLPLPCGDQPDRPGSTILMSAEDDPARTIVPRLLAAGADLTKIYILESVILANGSEALPSLRADIDAITSAAARLGDCRLIVIDPVSAYLRGVDDNRNAALRGVLSPLNRLAERLSAAVVLVSHLTKAGSSNGKHRVLGSIAYVGACRANYLFVADPDDQTGRRVLMVDNGGNVAPAAPPLAYAIENRESGPKIEWSDEPVTSVVAGPFEPARLAANQRDDPAVRHRACDLWLREVLTDGPRSAAAILASAEDEGFTKDQVRRARYRLGVAAVKAGFGAEGEWIWRLDARPVRD